MWNTLRFTSSFLWLGAHHTVRGYCILPLIDPDATLAQVHRWAQRVISLTERAGVVPEYIGLEHLPDGPCIVASGHEAMFEVFTLQTTLEDPSFVMNSYAAIWPHSTVLRQAGYFILPKKRLPTVREDMRVWARREVERGRKLVIFPQGKIVAPGASRAPRDGVFDLYQAQGFPSCPSRSQRAIVGHGMRNFGGCRSSPASRD